MFHDYTPTTQFLKVNVSSETKLHTYGLYEHVRKTLCFAGNVFQCQGWWDRGDTLAAIEIRRIKCAMKLLLGKKERTTTTSVEGTRINSMIVCLQNPKNMLETSTATQLIHNTYGNIRRNEFFGETRNRKATNQSNY